jgi:hypothetical protein
MSMSVSGASGAPQKSYRSSAVRDKGRASESSPIARTTASRWHWSGANSKTGSPSASPTFARESGLSSTPRTGSSIAMIDRHYGHLARDSHLHAVSLLDALAVERAVDAT